MTCTYFDRIQIVYVRYLIVFQDFRRYYRIPEVMQFISKLEQQNDYSTPSKSLQTSGNSEGGHMPR